MLIRFVVRNFRSFNNETELSMLPGKTKKHPEHVMGDSHQKSYHLLKTALLYGANAAGKSNLIEAIRFAQQFIIKGTRASHRIDFQRFRLDEEAYSQPARFEFEIKIQDKAYAYGFEVTPEAVVSEWLYEIGKTTVPKQLFDRTTENGQSQVEINANFMGLSKDDLQFLQFVAKGTRPNQLFLTECNERNVPYFVAIMNWFQNTLSVLPPPSSRSNSMEMYLQGDEQLIDNFVKALQGFNIDISGIHLKEIEYHERFNLPQEVLALLNNGLSEKAHIVVGHSRARFLIRNEGNGDSTIFRVVTTRRSSDGSDVQFEFGEESDGTIRLIDLLSGFITSLEDERVFIVDELDRSLHPILSYNFVDFFLKSTQGFPNQLIVTTHESSLLDLALLRRDEIWFVEKNPQGASELYSLEEFTPRHDKDIRRGYLHGRYGAIPIVRRVSDLGWR